MLQNIRQYTQGWIAQTFAAVIAITFAMFGINFYITSQGARPAIAKVNGEEVTQFQVDAAYNQLRGGIQQRYGEDFSFNAQIDSQLRRQAVAQTINTVVLNQAAKKSGFAISDDQVREALQGISAFQENGVFSAQRFSQFLGQLRYSPEVFLSELKRSMLISQVQVGYTESAFVLPSDLDDAIKLINQTRDIDFVVVPTSKFLKEVKVTDEEIDKFYQARQRQFSTQEQVRLEYIQLSISDLAKKIKFTDDELKQFYEENINNYTTPARRHAAHILVRVLEDAGLLKAKEAKEKATDIKSRIDKGEKFEALVKEESDDIVSRKEGGDLGWIKRSTFDDAFADAVAALKKKGDISDPVRTKYGYHIIKLLDLEEKVVKSFAEAREDVQTAMERQAAEKQFADYSEEMSNLTFANPGSLKVAAETLNLKIQTTEFFDRRGADKGISTNRRVAQAAFSDDVLNGKNNSEVIEFDEDSQIVLRIKEHKAPSVRPLEEVRDQIIEQMKNAKARRETREAGQKILDTVINNEGTLKEAANEFKLEVQTKVGLNRDDEIEHVQVVQEAFRMFPPEKDKVISSGVPLSSGDYAVVVLNKVTDGVLGDDAEEERAKIRDVIETDLGQFDYQLYGQGQIEKAKIKDMPGGVRVE